MCVALKKCFVHNSHISTTLTYVQAMTPCLSDSLPDASLSWVLVANASHALLDTTDHGWLAGWLTAQPKAPCWDWNMLASSRVPPEDMALHQCSYHLCTILTFFLQSSERDLAGGGGHCWGKQSVGWQSEDKGRMDRCCCQDLSAVTNGCCKDEASKTLENSDVVNHRYECVCVCARLCVFYMCLSVCFSDCVGEWKRKCVCVHV